MGFNARARQGLVFVAGILATLSLNLEQAAAWGDEGHMAVATIAFNQLPQSLQAEVRQILAGDTVTAACGKGSFIEDAVWPDKLREKPGQCASTVAWGKTEPWHFLDIPTSASSYEHARDCPNDDCVVAKIKAFQTILADKSETKARRRDALKFLIHFVGDLHQPLHTTSAPFNRLNAEKAATMGAKKGNKCLVNHLPMDRGGNCVDVRYKANAGAGGEGKATELHAFWDSDVVVAISSNPAEVADAAIKGMSAADIKAVQQGTVEDWTNEGHQIAVKMVYADLPSGPMPQLGGAYADKAQGIALNQIRRGGLRLAKLLEDTLK